MITMPARVTRRAAGTIAALALAAIGATTVAAPAQAAPSTAAAQQGFVRDVNLARAAHHRSPLAADAALTAVARRWAGQLAASNTLRHNPNVTRQVKGWNYLGENVGVGYGVQSLHEAFMASAPHRANVLNTHYSRIGVGVAYGHGRMWVVEVFELPKHRAELPKRQTELPKHRTELPKGVYGFGSRGKVVRQAQRRLGVRPTGYFGPVTLAHVTRYQRTHHLPVTGRLDRTTRARLHV